MNTLSPSIQLFCTPQEFAVAKSATLARLILVDCSVSESPLIHESTLSNTTTESTKLNCIICKSSPLASTALD